MFLLVAKFGRWLIEKGLAPNPPTPSTRLGHPKIAIIGAGITGVTAAAHCIGHGFDVVLFEAGSEERVGGIWTVRYISQPVTTSLAGFCL
jgi:monoamine oxidase